MTLIKSPVATPDRDHIDCTQLGADVLAYAGFAHPTRSFIAEMLELLVSSLENVVPVADHASDYAERLADHFRGWAEAIREEADTDLVPRDNDEAEVMIGQTHALVPWSAIHRLRALADNAGYALTQETSIPLKALRDAARYLPHIGLRPIRMALSLEAGVVTGGALDSQFPIRCALIDCDSHQDGARTLRLGPAGAGRVVDIALGGLGVNMDDVFHGPEDKCWAYD